MKRFLMLAALLAFAAPAVYADDEKPAEKKKAVDKTKAFATIDADSDGKISKEEFKKSMEKLLEKAKEKVESSGKGKGKGGDMLEKVLEKVADKAFEKLDADKDGSISKDEFEKAEFDPSNLKDLASKFGKKGDK